VALVPLTRDSRILSKIRQKEPTKYVNNNKTRDEEIDLTDITRNNSQPTLISITKARREISRQLQSRVGAGPASKDHGQSYLVWDSSDWLKKRQVTDILNQTMDQETLIQHGLNQFKGHLDLRHDIKAWKQFDRADKIWKKFKSHFTKAINDNRNDMGTLKAIEIANAVKEQVDQNKENQQLLAQATDEANDKIEQLEKQQAQLYAALMAKQPQQLQDNTAATIKALTGKINRLGTRTS
jgi:hypothetical protein